MYRKGATNGDSPDSVVKNNRDLSGERLFLRLGIMLSMHITKTIECRAKRDYCNQIIDG